MKKILLIFLVFLVGMVLSALPNHNTDPPGDFMRLEAEYSAPTAAKAFVVATAPFFAVTQNSIKPIKPILCTVPPPPNLSGKQLYNVFVLSGRLTQSDNGPERIRKIIYMAYITVRVTVEKPDYPFRC
jgi:hypothetical protein